MFIIASLIVVLLHNGIDMQERSTAKNQVAAANLFLYFLVPLLIFNYLGTVHHSEAGLITPIYVPFLVFLALWVVCMAWWAGYKLFPERCSCTRNMEESLNEPQNAKVAGIFYCLGLAVPIVSVVFLATNFVDFPDTFLVTCILETTLVILGKGFLRLVTFRKSKKSFENSQTSETKRETKRGVLCVFLRPLRVAYVLGTVCIGIAAFVFFFFKETTNKVKSPEQSRDLNQECYWLDFLTATIYGIFCLPLHC